MIEAEERTPGSACIDLGDDDGWLTIEIDGASITVDVYRANAVLLAHHNANKGKPDSEYGETLGEALGTLGIPPLSHRGATRVCEAVFACVAELKKKDEGLPGSSGSTVAHLSETDP